MPDDRDLRHNAFSLKLRRQRRARLTIYRLLRDTHHSLYNQLLDDAINGCVTDSMFLPVPIRSLGVACCACVLCVRRQPRHSTDAVVLLWPDCPCVLRVCACPCVLCMPALPRNHARPVAYRSCALVTLSQLFECDHSEHWVMHLRDGGHLATMLSQLANMLAILWYPSSGAEVCALFELESVCARA